MPEITPSGHSLVDGDFVLRMLAHLDPTTTLVSDTDQERVVQVSLDALVDTAIWLLNGVAGGQIRPLPDQG